MNISKPAFKILLTVLMLPLVIMSSCSDDDDPIIDQANLAGDTWNFDSSDAGDEFASAFIDAFLEGSEYTFNSDKTYVAVQLGFETEGTWSFSDGKVTLNPGDELESVWEVVELTATTLVYIATTIDDETEEESKVTYTFKR